MLSPKPGMRPRLTTRTPMAKCRVLPIPPMIRVPIVSPSLRSGGTAFHLWTNHQRLGGMRYHLPAVATQKDSELKTALSPAHKTPQAMHFKHLSFSNNAKCGFYRVSSGEGLAAPPPSFQ